MAGLIYFGDDAEQVKGYSFKSFKGKEGQKERLGFVFEDDPKKIFVGVPVHFSKAANRYFVCKSEGDSKAVCCTHVYEGNKPRWRVGAVIVIYKMDGNKPTGYKLMPWVFTDKMYQKLKTAGQEFPLAKHDVWLSCTNEQYQTMDINSCRESIWQAKPDLRKKIVEESKSIREEVENNLAQDLPIEEVREILGIDAPGSADAAVDTSLGDVVEGL
jgi:hypothetical protein